ELENANQDTKLTVTALLAKAIVLALKDYGAMNARYENGQLTEYDDVHLGVATSLDEGLMVPVINNADTKSIGALAKEINLQQKRYVMVIQMMLNWQVLLLQLLTWVLVASNISHQFLTWVKQES